MGISQYLKEIGRGREGARALSREQARDLMGQVLDGQCTDLEVGAFCIGMRVKGETPAEMAGFLDAVHERMTRPAAAAPLPVVVLPSYNGARKQPVLTPLLALLLARKGWPVLVHGMATESRRVSTENVFQALGQRAQAATEPIAPGQVHYVPTAALHPGLTRLLDARRAIGLRNPAHSLVKLMNPVAGLARASGPGRVERAAGRTLPARVLRRAAAAGLHRPRPGARSAFSFAGRTGSRNVAGRGGHSRRNPA